MQERAEKLAPAAALALYLVLLGTVLVLAGVAVLFSMKKKNDRA